jgi:hypothetical protein
MHQTVGCADNWASMYSSMPTSPPSHGHLAHLARVSDTEVGAQLRTSQFSTVYPADMGAPPMGRERLLSDVEAGAGVQG